MELRDSANTDNVINGYTSFSESNDINTNSFNINSSSNRNSNATILNTSEELKNIPKDIRNYLEENNASLVTFKNIESFHIIKCARLFKTENVRAKDFNFEFDEKQNYYFFITKEINQNYLKEKIENPLKINFQKLNTIENTPEKKNENIPINLNFDYNKYTLKAVFAKIPTQNSKMQIFRVEILNREICQISHTNLESIGYYKSSKVFKPEKAKKNYLKFELLLEKYYMLELETKKPANEIMIKEDGILSVLYIMTSSKREIIKLYTMIKYSLHFIKETIYNYVGKYLRDMLYDFCHLPSECLEDFLSHIGSLTQSSNNNYKITFPLKKYIKLMKNLSEKNLINHMHRNLPNISRQKAADRVPFHKFILMYEKYIKYYSDKEFKIKQKYLDEKKSKRYSFLKPSLIYDPINDKITKEHKINLNTLLKSYFAILEKFLYANLSQDNNKIKNFMIKNLTKFITQYTAFKGFFNVDIIMNEDNVFEFRCTNNKKVNQKINQNMFGCVVQSLACINCIFGFNEGFFHKHFTLMDYSYNFNEKNVIHTFLSCNDSSTKNKIRVFDIPFMDKWGYQIAGLLLVIYRDNFGFLNKNVKNLKNKNINFHNNFCELFDEISNNINEDIFNYYEKVLPDFYNFCSEISLCPLDKYNCLDNLCQNFANNSLNILLNNDVIFFSPFDVIFDINKRDLINRPNLNSILEPYLILVDENLKIYLDKKEKKEQYLNEMHLDIRAYFDQLKYINIEKVHYSIFLTEQNEIDSNENEIEEEEVDDSKENNESNIINTSSNSGNSTQNVEEFNVDKVYPEKMQHTGLKKISEKKIQKEIFDFYFLFNLYFNFTYTTMKELKTIFINYDIIKRYIASIESSVTISFHDYDKTIIKTNDKNIINIKTTKKNTKKNIIKDLKIMKKLTTMTRHMILIFSDYVKSVIQDIIKFRTGRFAQKNALDDKYYLKIGHYMINFLLYEKKGINYNSFQYFQSSEIYKKLNDENWMINDFVLKE